MITLLAEFTVADYHAAREAGLDVMDELTWRVLCWQISIALVWGGRARWTAQHGNGRRLE